MNPRYKEVIKIGSLEMDFLLDGDDTDNALVMFEMIVPSDAIVPAPHYHVAVDEVLYGLEGILTQIVEGEKRELHPGEKYFIKRGTVHGFENNSDRPARVLCVLTPALIGPAYFREIAELVNDGGPPDRQKMLSIMKKHGLEVVK